MGTKLKYMGTADSRTIPKGSDFGGQLATPLSSEVRFDVENHWVVDASEAGLSSEAVQILTENDNFKDVTDLKRIPPNEHQSLYRGMKSVSDEETAAVSEAAPSASSTPTVSSTGSSTKGSTSP